MFIGDRSGTFLEDGGTVDFDNGIVVLVLFVTHFAGLGRGRRVAVGGGVCTVALGRVCSCMPSVSSHHLADAKSRDQ